MPIRVLVIDDSAVMRKLLTEFINSQPDLEVVGAAPDAPTAREMIKTVNPDVLTLDVAMPKMDGLEFLERLMRLRPMPVVMVSSYTEAGSDTTLKALELGAVEFIGKPRVEPGHSLDDYAQELAEKIRAAKGARLRKPPAAAQPVPSVPRGVTTNKIIFVGASTGGTEALKHFLLGMPADCPPILVVQHMPETFTASFAKRLDSLCAPRVIESKGNEKVEAGTVYIAPGHSHLQVRKTASGLVTELLQTPPVNRHRPAVDVLFHSAAQLVGRNALGVILTGMGKDGAQGLLAMHQAGARTYGQDEASCVVYGMPREAAQIGAVDEVVSLDEMSRRVLAGLGR
ncbi:MULTISPECIES: protein-glutamate methylesterase/protein-glutamine glutaminase [Azospira]|uniref:Protein-glutamate methylesterase/protein-glutamine glutaminase n=2 Tax=Azospira oryzae TaxID=146939 RepID=G8QG25_AZOOP|nr:MULTISPECIES: chemotaxis response regulator protein-glutamate methylesterase [Azospira]AEV26098.1 chemotaxis response regulator containing a CheY-like receiver domain and a methylesterase domain [Azospira oryzae PS]MDK9690426.1 chemotaxis response regulator protein-glutamate methylesterase [Azospira sp.]RZT75634.1 response regulator receiver-modulated CheB methylesterase [Azospira oryzae]